MKEEISVTTKGGGGRRKERNSREAKPKHPGETFGEKISRQLFKTVDVALMNVSGIFTPLARRTRGFSSKFQYNRSETTTAAQRMQTCVNTHSAHARAHACIRVPKYLFDSIEGLRSQAWITRDRI